MEKEICSNKIIIYSAINLPGVKKEGVCVCMYVRVCAHARVCMLERLKVGPEIISFKVNLR